MKRNPTEKHRHSDILSLHSQGREFGLGKKRVPVLHFIYPPPPDPPGLFNIPQAMALGEAAGPGQLWESTVRRDGPERQSQQLIWQSLLQELVNLDMQIPPAPAEMMY